METEIKYVRDIPEEYILLNLSQDVDEVLKLAGLTELIGQVGIVFIRIEEDNTEYPAYYCYGCVPYLDKPVYVIP